MESYNPVNPVVKSIYVELGKDKLDRLKEIKTQFETIQGETILFVITPNGLVVGLRREYEFDEIGSRKYHAIAVNTNATPERMTKEATINGQPVIRLYI